MQKLWALDDHFRKHAKMFSIDKVNEVEVPTLLIHGKCDEFISIDHCYAIYARLRNPVPPLHVENATHGNIIDHGKSCARYRGKFHRERRINFYHF